MQCKDLYTNLASDMFSVPCSQVTPEMRRVAKSRAFAHAYTPKKQASGGTYTARVSGVTCDGGKVEVRLDNVERVSTCDYADLEARVAASLCQADAKRADEYEKLLLKAFPLVSKKAGPAETQRLLTVAPTKAVCRLISKLTGVRYAFRASVAKAEAEARERAKAAAKDTWQAATFAATIAGGVVGSVLTYLLV
ncbi:DNA-binding protein [Pseudomonas phage vB_PaeP_FBPa6]|nr:DNA-binding protein [Pseudomonas phage vB_PaeP_FBPa6]